MRGVARPLKVLVPLIRADVTAGETTALAHCRDVGTLLLEAREQVPARQWTTWLAKTFGLDRRTAWRYMRLADPELPTYDSERRLQRELAREITDLGYRALATRLHPDRGGSKEAMARLNRVRATLRTAAMRRSL